METILKFDFGGQLKRVSLLLAFGLFQNSLAKGLLPMGQLIHSLR